MTKPSPFGPRIAALVRELEKRVVVIDGAMGTMAQARKLGEADYRGDRFKDHPQDLKGNHDLLNLTRPDVVRSFHREYLLGGRCSRTNNQVRLHFAGRERPRGARGELRRAGGGLPRAGPGSAGRRR